VVPPQKWNISGQWQIRYQLPRHPRRLNTLASAANRPKCLARIICGTFLVKRSQQARQWLRAELAARARAFDTGSKATRGAKRLALTRWRNEPDLAGLREPGELNKLPADERSEYLALWADVAAVLARTER
jgi:hypothetical protein